MSLPPDGGGRIGRLWTAASFASKSIRAIPSCLFLDDLNIVADISYPLSLFHDPHLSTPTLASRLSLHLIPGPYAWNLCHF